MATQVQWRGGSTAEHSTFTGAAREVTVDTQKKTLVVHDGSTAGGEPLLREDQANLPSSVTNGISVPSANNVAISTNGTGRLFIDSSGRLLVGTSSAPPAIETLTPGLVRSGSGIAHDDYSVGIYCYRNAGGSGRQTVAPRLYFARSRSGTNGSTGGIVNNNEDIGNIRFAADDGTNFITAAEILAEIDGTPGDNDMPGRIILSTTGSGASSPTERMRIDSAGTTTLTSAAATAPFIAKISTAEVARIDGSGRLLVGTSSALSNIQTAPSTYGAPQQQIASTDQFGAHLAVMRFNASDAAGSYLSLTKSYSATVGNNVLVPTDSLIGRLQFQANDGTNYLTAARIEAYTDGTTGANDMPGRLVFSTTADGESSPTERMRINNAGMIRIAQSTTDDPSIANVVGTTLRNDGLISTSASSTYSLALNRISSDGNIAAFHRAGTAVGTISVTTTATAYNTSSDYRLKGNVVPLTGAADRLNQLQVHRFNFIADPDTTVDGFLAHEAQVVVPECVTGTKDEVDDEGNPVYQGIDQSKLVPLLTAALQEALAEIESLKARVTALEP